MSSVTRPTEYPDWATDDNFPSSTDPDTGLPNAWSTKPNKVTPPAGKVAEGFDPNEDWPAEWFNDRLNKFGRWARYLDGNEGGACLYSDGSDGDVTLDGTVAAPSWATKSSSTYTMTRDCHVGTLTLTGASTVLKTNGYRLLYQGDLVTSGGAKINCNGNAASGQTAGTASPTGSLAGGAAGGLGGAGSNGNGAGGSNTTSSYGGAGTSGANGGGTGGAGGTATAPTATFGQPRRLLAMLLGYLFGTPSAPVLVAIQGGAGGGGGGGGSGGGNVGGGGGGGGGVAVIAGRNLKLESASDIVCAGGAGGAVGATGGPGNGSGGGGGFLLLVYHTKNDGLVFSGATNCPGGAGGTGGGVNGAAGAPGTVIELCNGGASVAQPVLDNTPHHVEQGFSAITAGTGEAHEFLTITFDAQFLAATGANGYDVTCSIYRSDGGPEIGWWISTKTTSGMVLSFADSFDGEVRWRAFR